MPRSLRNAAIDLGLGLQETRLISGRRLSLSDDGTNKCGAQRTGVEIPHEMR